MNWDNRTMFGRGSRPSTASGRRESLPFVAAQTQPRPNSYVPPGMSGWGSCDYFHVRPTLSLPPELSPLQIPSRFTTHCEEWQEPPRTGTRLRRWGNYHSLQAASNSAQPFQHYNLFQTRSSQEVRSRSEIGSMQQLPTVSHVSQFPRWHQSCRSISSASSNLICVFCKSNREPPEVYTSHQLRGSNGAVVCPILRRYRCRHCGATGDAAHTDSYCPENPNRGLRSSMKSVLQTRLMSSGKMRTDSTLSPSSKQ